MVMSTSLLGDILVTMEKQKQVMDEINNLENEPVPEIKTTTTQIHGSEELPSQFISPKQRRWLKKGPLNRKELIIFGFALILLVGSGCGLIWWMNQVSFVVDETVLVRKKPQIKYYSPLNGLEVIDEVATKRAVTAVMIENSDYARPQSGLAEADVVFEAVAEGGITRFIALYQTSRPSLIGPVRSLRPYYVEWAASFDPSVAHVGGSPDALNMIRSGNYGLDIDQFFNSGSYWRATDRSAPHNVYTDSDKLDSLNSSKNKTTSTFTFAPRVNEKKSTTPTANRISLEVSSGIFNVSYNYNQGNNSYDRMQGSEAHVDREKGQISPKVVVAIKTNISLSSDGSHMNISAIGSGQAFVFQNGIVTEGSWSKSGPKEQLVIKDANGKDIELIRGQTWITAVANERSVSWQ